MVIIAYFLTHAEKVEGLAALLSRIPAFWSLRFDKTYVASDIQSKLNSYAKTLNSETVEIMPYPARIEWVRSIDRQALIKENEVVIKLDSHTEQERNLVYATVAYVSQGLFPYSRQYVDDRILKACDLVVASKILGRERKELSLRLFMGEFLVPLMKQDAEMRKNVRTLMKLDGSGYFIAILLREFWDLGRRLYPQEATGSIKQETKDLLQMLEKLAEKKKGEDINTTLQEKDISTTVVFVGRPEVVASFGIDPYIRWIDKCVENGIRTIHILARGKMNINVARIVAEHFSSSMKIQKIEEEQISVKGMPETIHFLFKERIT